MFINNDLIYIQLQKTGCTHIADLIAQRWPGEGQLDDHTGKHRPLQGSPDGRAILGSIRNPQSWYVSLWAYGCQAKGELAWFLTAPTVRIARTEIKKTLYLRKSPVDATVFIAGHAGKDVGFWQRVYSDPDDVGHFREWLAAIHAPAGMALMPDGYAEHPLRHVAGFYTYRFLFLFTGHDAWKARSRSLRDYDAMRAFYDETRIADHFVRTENINEDLGRALTAIRGTPVNFDSGAGQTNRSKHRPTADYYDDATRALLHDRDRLIYEVFYPEAA